MAKKGMKRPDVTHIKPISPAHGIVDTDSGRDNAANDLSNADLQDL